MKKLVCRLVCLLCVAAMLMGCASAMAEAPVISNLQSVRSHWNPPFDHNVWKPIASFDINTAAKITSTIYAPDGTAFNTPKIDGAYAADAAVEAGSVVLDWPAVDYNGWHAGDGEYVNYRIVVQAQNSDGIDQDTTYFDIIYSHDIDQHAYQPDPDAPIDPLGDAAVIEEPVPAKATYYANNTVCSFGPHFRDLTPELTKKWYMFTVLDLSQDGVQEYELVAGNVFVVGRVYVAVEGDSLTVSYRYVNENIYDHGEFFTIFPDYASITTVEPSEIENAMEYDVTYSIAEDLDGDTDVILFVCNIATFRDDVPGLVRFYENIPERKALREAMLAAIGMSEAE